MSTKTNRPPVYKWIMNATKCHVPARTSASSRYSHVFRVCVSMRKVFPLLTKPIFDTHIHTIVKTSNNEICHCKSVHIYYFAIKAIHSCVCVCMLPWDKRWTFTQCLKHFWLDNKVTISYTIQVFWAPIHSTQIFPVLSFAVQWRKDDADWVCSSVFPSTDP